MHHILSVTANMASRALLRPFAQQNTRLFVAVRARSTAITREEVEHDTKDGLKSFEEIPGPGTGLLKTAIVTAKMMALGDVRKPWPMMELYRKQYGPMWTQRMGKEVMLFLSDPKEVAKVFRNEGKYPRRITAQPWTEYRDYRGHAYGVLLQEGTDWHRHRRTLSKRMMRPKEIKSYNDVVNDVVTDMINKCVRVKQDDNIVPNIEEIVFNWALESACAVILNKKMDLLSDNPNPEAQAFIQAVRDMFDTTLLLFLIPTHIQKRFNTRTWRTHVSAWDTIFATAKKLIDERMNKETTELLKGDRINEEETDFVTYMASKETMDTAEIYGNATDLLAAAVDTTSNTLLWALYCLGKNPQAQKILHDEVNSVVPLGEIPSHKHVDQMPYLKAVMKESMRMFPTVIAVNRVLEEDIVLRGYTVPAKTNIMASNWLMGRDPELFEDPMDFKPQRWLREEKEHFDGFRFLPFGFGPRMCIGKRIADLEINLAVARISQQFILDTTADVEPMVTSIMQPDRPLNLKFIKRTV